MQEQTYDEYIQNILDTRGRFGIPKGEYKERHHIIPRCVGGTDDEDNLIDLYAKEHFIAHKLLYEEDKENKQLARAWIMMSVIAKNQKRYILTAEEYDEIRKLISILSSGENSPMYNSEWYTNGDDEIKVLVGELPPQGWVKGRKPVSENTKSLASLKLKGRTWFTDGINEVFDYVKPVGYWAGRSKQLKEKTSNNKLGNKYNVGKHLYNNGLIQTYAYECPPGFVVGGLPMPDHIKEKHRTAAQNNENYLTRKNNRGFETLYAINERINEIDFKNDFYLGVDDNELCIKYNITICMCRKYRKLKNLIRDSQRRPKNYDNTL